MNLETRYRTLLRWYPRAWRSSHEEVVLGTLLDAAAAEGRAAPTAGEAWNIRWTGAGERFTISAALIATAGALLATLAHTSVTIFGLGSIAQIGGGWIPATLGQFLSPLLLTFTALCLLRHSRIIVPQRAVTVFACAIPAWALAAATAVSWSVGFDEADAGGIASPFALAFLPLLAAAWTFGAGAVFLVVDAMLRRVPYGARWATAGTAALVTPPAVGVAMMSPVTAALVGLGLLFLCGFRQRPGLTPPRAAPLPVTLAVRRRVVVFAMITLVISSLSVAFALTGVSWSTGIDATRAMQVGLCAGQLCAIPLLFCSGWIQQDRRPAPTVRRWFPVVTLAVGLSLTALDTMTGFTQSGHLPWPGLTVIAIGLSSVVFQMLRTTGPIRVILAVATGLALLVPVWLAIVMLGFSVPIAATIMMIWGSRSPRTGTTTPLAASA